MRMLHAPSGVALMLIRQVSNGWIAQQMPNSLSEEAEEIVASTADQLADAVKAWAATAGKPPIAPSGRPVEEWMRIGAMRPDEQQKVVDQDIRPNPGNPFPDATVRPMPMRPPGAFDRHVDEGPHRAIPRTPI